MKLEKSTTGDIVLSLIIPGWGILIRLIALIKMEFQRGLTMFGLSVMVIAVIAALRT